MEVEVVTPEGAEEMGYERRGPDSYTSEGLIRHIAIVNQGGQKSHRVVVDNSNSPFYLGRAGGAQFTVWERRPGS